MKLIHVQTQVVTTFGFIDEDGDIVETKNIQATLQKINEESLLELLSKINEARDELLKMIPGE